MTAVALPVLADPEVEQAVLGAILIEPSPTVVHRVRQLLPDPGMFSVPAHRDIYAAMLALADRGMPIEPLSLRAELQARHALDASGGLAYLGQLADDVATAALCETHGRLVRDRALRRQFRDQAARAQRLAEDLSIPVGDAVAEVVGGFVEASGLSLSEGLRSVQSLGFQVMQDLEERGTRGTGMVGVTTGLPDLDELTGGWRRGDLIVLAARPSGGKTARAIWTALEVATAVPDEDVIVFSLEMTRAQLVERMVAAEASVPLNRVTRGQLTNHEYAKVAQAMGELMRLPIHIDTDLDSPARIRLAVQHHMATTRRKVSLVVIDYLQLMQADDPDVDNRTQEIGLITRGLKRQVAHALDVPVLLLSQLSRANVRDRVRPPELSDLRDSGEIEQDADVVEMLHYDWKDPDTHPELEHHWGNRNRTEIYLRKQRNGPTGELQADYQRATGRWHSYPKGLDA